MMKLRKEWTHERCPRCSESPETTEHVLKCQAPAAKATWAKTMAQLETWMIQAKTDPAIQRTILRHLNHWQQSSVGTPGPPVPRLRQALESQLDIGWHNLMEGKVSDHWGTVQEAYYKTIGSQKSGLRWTTALIQKLLDVSWDMWDHRNSIRHNNPHPAWDPDNSAPILAQVHAQWTQGAAGLLQGDRHYFTTTTLEQLTNSTLPQQQAWVVGVQQARDLAAAAQQQGAGNMDHERQALQQWLNSTRTDASTT